MSRRLLAPLAIALALVGSAATAQERKDGAIVGHGAFGRSFAPDEFKLYREGQLKGVNRVAIAVFDVAFPQENHFTANTRGQNYIMSHASKATMTTHLVGVDAATRQRITDKAYALFVGQLKAAGYEVVEPAALSPEFAGWASIPNQSLGRLGYYVAPTGQPLRLLQGDAAKRDTSGTFGQLNASFRAFDRPVAFDRSPYVAHDAKVGVIAVTLVLDYGVYSSSGEKKGMGHASADFAPGVSAAAGDLIDHGSLLQYWSPSSGGFPVVALLQQPIRSAKPIGELTGAPGDWTMQADPRRFEAAADEVVAEAAPKFVSLIASKR